MAYAYVLCPGRHHPLTRFEAERASALPWPDTHLRLVARRPVA